MVYIQSWQDFQDAAEALYSKSPKSARYCVKWKASEGKLVLKITDNITCIKFKTYSSIFLNRFEALNLSLMQKMQNRRREVAVAPPPGTPLQVDDISAGPTPAAASTVIPSAPGAAAGGVKKKKPKKKK